MSAWETVENAVVQALAALTSEGVPLLATVRGHSAAERKLLVAALERERMPAAYVVLSGREPGEKAARRPGTIALSVWLATRSHRHEDDARIGAADVTGMFELAEQVAGALQDLLVGDDRRLLMVEESAAGGPEGTFVWEQQYEVRRLAELTAPTFGGATLVGTDSEVHVEVGPLRRAASSFSFPGVDGIFTRHLGTRGRSITWRGQLRAASDSALNAIETGIESELRDGQDKTMVDGWSRPHELCVVKSFVRRGLRRRDELTGEALQDFELEFEQLDR